MRRNKLGGKVYAPATEQLSWMFVSRSGGSASLPCSSISLTQVGFQRMLSSGSAFIMSYEISD